MLCKPLAVSTFWTSGMLTATTANTLDQNVLVPIGVVVSVGGLIFWMATERAKIIATQKRQQELLDQQQRLIDKLFDLTRNNERAIGIHDRLASNTRMGGQYGSS
jgi:hypothetical protein